nr:hypothetical protein [Alienimonas californiensis]
MFPQLREQRDRAFRSALVVLGLRGVHRHPVPLPVHVLPRQREQLGDAPQAPEPGEGDDQPPLGVRAGGEHPLGLPAGDEVELVGVAADLGLLTRERVAVDEFLANRGVEHLLRAADPPGDGVAAEGLREAKPVVVRVAGGDRPQRAARTKIRLQVGRAADEVLTGLFLEVGAGGGVGVRERPHGRRRPGDDEAGRRQLGVQAVVEPVDPGGDLFVRRLARPDGRVQPPDHLPDTLGGLPRNLPEPHGFAAAVEGGELDPAAAADVGAEGGHRRSS